MAFADMNNDKYTDIVTVNDQKTSFTIHLFDPVKKMFLYQKTFKPASECDKIQNIVVGRSIERVRIFLTCSSAISGGNSMIKIYDKIKNIELQEQKITI